MATEEMSLLPSTSTTVTAANHRHDKGGALNPSPQQQVLFRHCENAAAVQRFPPFHRHSGDPGVKTTRELTTAFIDDSHRFFQPPEFRLPVYATPIHAWNFNGPPPGGHGSDGGENEEDDDDDGEELNEGDGSNRGLCVKERNVGASRDDSNNNMNSNKNVGVISCENRASQCQNAGVTIADPNGDLYYQQHYLQGQEGSTSVGRKDVSLVENGCGFSARRDVAYSSDSGESLRKILSDPVTGSLMDDAMILPCGHSFGGGGVQHVIKMIVVQLLMPDPETLQVLEGFSSRWPSLIPFIPKPRTFGLQPQLALDNISESDKSDQKLSPRRLPQALRAAVQAFRREEEMRVHRASKRRREKFEQDKSNYGDLSFLDHPRGKGVQFPFSVTDRVVIKGNKRTPQRFVGREAVVTTQCLNGWYVVKTLDNAESVKLQYRSLAKVSDNVAVKQLSTKAAPNWL